MNENLKKDLAELDLLLERAKNQGLDFFCNIGQHPVSIKNQNPQQGALPEEGSGTAQALNLFNEKFRPLMVASAGPRYWGFVTGGTTPASVVGDWLTSVYDQNPQALAGQGDISALIEAETIQLLLDLFHLPDNFLGGFVTGATMSNFSCLAVARQWIGKRSGKDFAREGVTSGIKILAATPHSSVIKSLSMSGIGSNNIIKVRTAEGNKEAIDIPCLEEKIAELNGAPFILISSAGTVNTVDFDDFTAIAELRKKYHFWWHIDAAFGGFAACSRKYRHLVKDWNQADSITIDCHKWMNVPYESALFFIKESHKVLQMETFQNSNAPYLGDPMESFSYLNFLPENSRRLKALPAWFSLMAYGKEGYQEIIENSVEMALFLGRFIEESPGFELLAPVRLNTVCFTLKGEENQDKVVPFLSCLNNSGKIFMTPAFYNGKKGIRAAFVNWRTTESDITIAITEMQNSFKKIVNKNPGTLSSG